MKPITDEWLAKTLRSLTPQIGMSYATMGRYINTGNFSAESCIQIEKATNGRISAVQLRPDIFKELPAHQALASVCVNHFVNHIKNDNHELIIGVLNFMESQQPELYTDMLSEISSLENGKRFVAQRLAHKENGKLEDITS